MMSFRSTVIAAQQRRETPYAPFWGAPLEFVVSRKRLHGDFLMRG